MPFGLVSAWKKRLRSRSLDQGNPCNTRRFTIFDDLVASFSFSNHQLLPGTYKAIEFRQLEDRHQAAQLPPSKEADGEREFRVEVDILSRLDHPNLVTLMGYCADGKHRFLVYEFMQKGNLSQSSYTLESIAMFANLASRCVRPEGSERPLMAECTKELQLIHFVNSKALGITQSPF